MNTVRLARACSLIALVVGTATGTACVGAPDEAPSSASEADTLTDLANAAKIDGDDLAIVAGIMTSSGPVGAAAAVGVGIVAGILTIGSDIIGILDTSDKDDTNAKIQALQNDIANLHTQITALSAKLDADFRYTNRRIDQTILWAGSIDLLNLRVDIADSAQVLAIYTDGLKPGQPLPDASLKALEAEAVKLQGTIEKMDAFWSLPLPSGTSPSVVKQLSILSGNQRSIALSLRLAYTLAGVPLDVPWFTSHVGIVMDQDFGTLDGQLEILAERLRHPYTRLRCAADFNGDGIADIVTHDPLTQKVEIWPVSATGYIGNPGGKSISLGVVDPNRWSLRACADINGDGKADILWGDFAHTKQAYFWLMNGLTNTGHTVTMEPPYSQEFFWTPPRFLGDFDGDHHPDFLSILDDFEPHQELAAVFTVRNETFPYAPNGFPGDYKLAPIGAPGWDARGAGDVSHDGIADVIWYNPSARTVSAWITHGNDGSRFDQINGANIGSAYYYTADLRLVGDFNGDGNADLLWQMKSGAMQIWQLNGTTVVKDMPTYAAPPFRIYHL